MYDIDEPVDSPVKPARTVVEVPQQSSSPVVFRAVNFAKGIPLRTWIVGGSFAVALLVYSTQWKQQSGTQELKNPTDARAIPAFDESKLLAANLKEVGDQEQQINSFIREERQRIVIAVAQGFRGLAIANIANSAHACSGLTELQCLNTFDANRIASLTALTQPVKPRKRVSSNPNLIFKAILDGSSEVDRVAGLRLAKILAKPVNSRTAVEQGWIDTDFPILNAGLPAEELRPRPATLAQLMLQAQAMREKMLSTSRESTIRLQACLALPPEQQKKNGGCQ